MSDFLFSAGFARAQCDELMRQVQCGHDGDAVQADDLAAIADFAHAAVEIVGTVGQLVELFGSAGPHVFLFEDANTQGARYALAHALCSIDLTPPIMASTPVRTCSCE